VDSLRHANRKAIQQSIVALHLIILTLSPHAMSSAQSCVVSHISEMVGRHRLGLALKQ
jgi:hypothetical protein